MFLVKMVEIETLKSDRFFIIIIWLQHRHTHLFFYSHFVADHCQILVHIVTVRFRCHKLIKFFFFVFYKKRRIQKPPHTAFEQIRIIIAHIAYKT